ncbi:MAG: hypothetical protein ABIH68_06190 [bacterium]
MKKLKMLSRTKSAFGGKYQKLKIKNEEDKKKRKMENEKFYSVSGKIFCLKIVSKRLTCGFKKRGGAL